MASARVSQLSVFLSPLTGEPPAPSDVDTIDSLASVGFPLPGDSMGKSSFLSCITGDDGPVGGAELRPQPVFLFSEAHEPHEDRYAPAR
jgi:hypothetical protein